LIFSLSFTQTHGDLVACLLLVYTDSGETCCVAFLWVGVSQAQATLAQWEGQLVRWAAVQAGLRQDGKGAVYRFAFGAPHCRANVLPRVAPGQVRNAILEAAVKDKPAVLVPQG
jgi:hypothetical protein